MQAKLILPLAVFLLFLVTGRLTQAQLKLEPSGGRDNEELRAAYGNYYSLHADRGMRQKLRIVDVLSAMRVFQFDKPENAVLLELTEQQLEDLSSLRQHYSRLIKEIYGELPGCSELDFPRMITSAELGAFDVETQNVFLQLKPCVELDIMNVLVESQIRQLAFVQLRMGLPKVVVESPIGQSLELSGTQQDRIAEKATQLSAEIDEFVKKIKRESVEIIRKELTLEQWQKLETIYGKNQLAEYPKGLSMEYLMRVYDMESIYPLPDPN